LRGNYDEPDDSCCSGRGFCASIAVLTCRSVIVVSFLWLLIPARVLAQTPTPGAPPSTVRVQAGPLFLNPLLGLNNIGIDNNVFNVPESEGPQRDFTMTVVPAVDLWLRFGRTWINSTVREELVYYQEFESERAANTNVRLNWMIPLNRLILNPGVVYLNTRERPGFEIDTRARRTDIGYNGTVELLVASKTYIGARGEVRTIEFQEGEEFDGTDLRDELNRTTTSGAVTVRYQATPLTALLFDLSRYQDRFEFSPDRDTDSTQFTAGLKFDPAALIKGSASAGYKNFRPIALAVPAYKGFIAGADISYVPLDSTRLTMTLGRDVQYSYDVNQPYYLQIGATGSISQQIFGPVDVVGRFGGERLEYRDRIGVPVSVRDRVDRVTTFGGGVGYHMGRDLRIGFNIDKQERTSAVDTKQYNGLRYGFTVTYGS
jgi:hypothetical protein